MFFIGVFGIENKDKDIKILENLNCKKCGVSTKGRLVKNYDFFHFFFLPLFKWNEKYYVICDYCKSIYAISKEKGKAIEHSEKVEVTYWDLQEIHNEYYPDYNFRICGKCGNRIESNFKYCPHCGEKI